MKQQYHTLFTIKQTLTELSTKKRKTVISDEYDFVFIITKQD